MKWSSLLVVLLAASARAESDSALLELMPPGTQVVIGVRVRSVVDSPLARSIGSEIQREVQAQQSIGDWQKLIAFTGFDPLHDIDEVLLGTTGEGEKAPALIVVRGNFDIAKLAANATTYDGVPLIDRSASLHGTNTNGAFAFLDEHTILAGEGPQVRAAIDRRGKPAPLSPGLVDRIAEFRGKYEIWGVVNHLDGLRKMAASSSGPQGLDSIDRLQFGVGLEHGLDLVAEIHSRSPKDAEQLSASLKLLQAMFLASPQSSMNGTKLALETTGESLRIGLSIPEEELKKSIETQLRARMAAQPRAAHLHAPPVISGQPPVTTPAVAAPGQPGPVRIQSAEHTRPVTAEPAAPGTTVFTLPSRP